MGGASKDRGRSSYWGQCNGPPQGRLISGISPRRFPPPWSVEEQDACYVVRDHDGQQLAYVYYENEPGRRSAAKLLTKDEARRIAANIAKLPRSSVPRSSCTVVRPHSFVREATWPCYLMPASRRSRTSSRRC